MLTIFPDNVPARPGGPALDRIADFSYDADFAPGVDDEAVRAEVYSPVRSPAAYEAPVAAPRPRGVSSRTLVAPEILFSTALLLLTLGVGASLGFRFHLPAGDRAAFVGIHYLYPLIGIAIWGVLAAIGQRRELARTFLIALPCYAIVLVCHFNLKLWAPFINPVMWDAFYWQTDELLRPVVDACFAIRRAVAPAIPLDSNFYMIAFIAMFYISFCIHALRSPQQFRTLFLAALLFQGLGALAYMIAPAVGPFLYETGVEPMQTQGQQGMLAAREALLAGGTAWVAANGGTHITVGLAAMPSLHTGGSFLFLLFAWRYARVLVPLYVALFAFIAVDAVASRWHYVIDLPAGVGLAVLCAWAAERLNARTRDSVSANAAAPAAPAAG